MVIIFSQDDERDVTIMKERLQIAVLGQGGRGFGMLQTILGMDNIDVIGICDRYEDRTQKGADEVEQKQGKRPFTTQCHKEILNMQGLDAVMIFTSWADHINVAVEAMRKGIRVACEVGGAYSVHDCWKLVNTYEETGVPCMLLENCCYGREEMMVLNMVRKGLFGEVIYCQGGYQHDLREEICYGVENRHYRLVNYKNRNCENYPTHELGPIAKILNINRGNRMLTLTATATKAAGLNVYAAAKRGETDELATFPFAQGDVITTVITCAHGQNIVLTLDTTLPRAYSRGFRVQGTKASFFEDTASLFIDGVHNKYDFDWSKQWGNVKEYREEHDHPVWKGYDPKGGHGGMDWLVLDAFFESVREGKAPPIDVYDMAAWMCVTALSEQSIAAGGQPVSVPDFTNGRWIARDASPASKYNLD